MKQYDKTSSPRKRARPTRRRRTSGDALSVVLLIGGDRARSLAADLLKNDVDNRKCYFAATISTENIRWQIIDADTKTISYHLSVAKRRTRSNSIPTTEVSGSPGMIKYFNSQDGKPLKLWIVADDDVFARAEISRWNREVLASLCEFIGSDILFNDLVVVSPTGRERLSWKRLLPYAVLVDTEDQTPSEIRSALIGRKINRLMVKTQKKKDASIVGDSFCSSMNSQQRSSAQSGSKRNDALSNNPRDGRTSLLFRRTLNKQSKELQNDTTLLQADPSEELFPDDGELLDERHPASPVLTTIDCQNVLKRARKARVSPVKEQQPQSKLQSWTRTPSTRKWENLSSKADDENCLEKTNESQHENDASKRAQRAEPAAFGVQPEIEQVLNISHDVPTLANCEYSASPKNEVDPHVNADSNSLGASGGSETLPFAFTRKAKARTPGEDALAHNVGEGKQAGGYIPGPAGFHTTPQAMGYEELNCSRGGVEEMLENSDNEEDIVWSGSVKVHARVSGKVCEEEFHGFEIRGYDSDAKKVFKERVFGDGASAPDPVHAELMRVDEHYPTTLALSGGHGQLELKLSADTKPESRALMDGWCSALVSPVLKIGNANVLCHWSQKGKPGGDKSLLCLFPKLSPLLSKDADFGLYRYQTFGGTSRLKLESLPPSLATLPTWRLKDGPKSPVLNSALESWTGPSTMDILCDLALKDRNKEKVKKSAEQRFFLSKTTEEKIKRRRRHSGGDFMRSKHYGNNHTRANKNNSPSSGRASIAKASPNDSSFSLPHPISAHVSNNARVRASKKAILKRNGVSRSSRSRISLPGVLLRSKTVSGARRTSAKPSEVSVQKKLLALNKSTAIRKIGKFYDYGKSGYKDGSIQLYPQKWRKLGNEVCDIIRADKELAKEFGKASDGRAFRKGLSGLHGVNWSEDGDRGDWWMRVVERIMGLRSSVDFGTLTTDLACSPKSQDKLSQLAAILKSKNVRGNSAVERPKASKVIHKDENVQQAPSFSRFFKGLGANTRRPESASMKRSVTELGSYANAPQKRRRQQAPYAPNLIAKVNSKKTSLPKNDTVREVEATSNAQEIFPEEKVQKAAVCEYFEETDEIRYAPTNGIEVVMPMPVAAPVLSILRLQNVDVSTKPSISAIAARFRRFSRAQIESMKTSTPVKAENLLTFCADRGFVVYQIQSVPVQIDLHVLGPLYAELLLAGVDLRPNKSFLCSLINYFEQVGLLKLDELNK